MIRNITIIAVLIFTVLFSNNAYSQAPLMQQPNIIDTMPCQENPGKAYNKEIDFSGLKLNLLLLNNNKCYMFRRKGFYLDASHVSRLQIKTASTTSDCERWLDEERNICKERIIKLEDSYKVLIKSLSDENTLLLEDNKNLKFELGQSQKKWKLSYSNIGIGIALGVVTSVIVVNVIK